MKYFIFLIFLTLSNSALCSDIVEYVVRHRTVEDYLIATDKHSIESIFSENENKAIEKINIKTYSLDFAEDIMNELLSNERMEAVYKYVLDYVDDKDKIELFNLNAVNTTITDPVSNTLITIYFYDKGNETPIPGIERELFPEEFDIEKESYIPKEFGINSKFKMEDVYFHGNSSIYKEESEESLEDLLHFLQANPGVEITIEGHVNGKLTKSYLKQAGKANPEKIVYKSSKHLSLARANRVKSYLVVNGIQENRIKTVGKGAEEMVYKKPRNKKQEEANRRIEVVINKN